MKNELEKIVTNTTLKKWALTVEEEFLKKIKDAENENGQLNKEKTYEAFTNSLIVAMNRLKGCE